MSTMIQIRNVPGDVHRRLKARAALEGLSMSEYVLVEIRKSLERPTRSEILARISELGEAKLAPTPAKAVRQEREAR